jgi:WD40 repeat protein
VRRLLHRVRQIGPAPGHGTDYAALGCWATTTNQAVIRNAQGSDDKLVKIWSVETGRLVATLRGHEVLRSTHTFAHSLYRLTGAIGVQGDITDISIDPENKYIASGSNDNIVRVWSLRDFSPIAVLSGHTNAVTAVAFSPSPFPKTRVLLSTSLDGSARLWWVDEMAQQMAQGDRYEVHPWPLSRR